jgi:hypothetical protein
MAKPKGSGYFAAVAGALFLALLLLVDVTKISREYVLRTWFFFAGAVLLGWGTNRAINGEDDWRVGQDTINFVVAIVGATAAILALN